MFKEFLKRLDKTFIFIVIFASILRFAFITYVPPALNWDETSIGYNAYSILTTGKDEWGVTFPTIFRAFGDYKLPGYIYISSISERFLGLNAFAVRLPSVLAGIGTVIFTYLLVLEIFNKKSLANLSALLVAVEPWSLFLSRGAFEANLSLLFIVSGVYFFLKSVRNAKFLLLSSLLFGLSVWTYNSARVFVPLLLIVLIALYFNDLKTSLGKNLKLFVGNLLILALFFIPMFVQLGEPVGQARYGKVSIVDAGAVARIEAARNSSSLPPSLNKLINNRYVYFIETFAKNWVSHYSPSFLFVKGGSDYQFSVPGMGLLYYLDAIPLIVGLIWLVLRRSKMNILIVAWFLLATIPSALTNEAPQVLRAIVVLPIPMIITAIGIFKIADFFKSKFNISTGSVIAIYVILLYLFFENYATVYATTYRTNYSWSWQYGYEQVVDYAKAHYNQYDKIIVTKKYGEPHEFFLFFLGYSSDKYRNDPNLIRYGLSNWFWVDRFDKFYFVNDWQIPHDKGFFVLQSQKETVDCTKTFHCLLITSPGNYPKGWKKLDTVNFLDGSSAFEMYTNN